MFSLNLLSLALLTPLATCIAVSCPRTGCGRPAVDPGQTQYRYGLKSGGKYRNYTYHLPADYDPYNRYPVVLGFHGSSGVGVFFEIDTKLSQARYSGDKIMIYPDGINGSWAGPSYHNGSTVQEDVAFVKNVIKDVKRRFCVDDERIFGVGMSNGGGFIGTLACDPMGSTLFTAYAAHSGAFYTDVNGPDNNCAPSNVVPMLEIHGTADTTVKYDGGQGSGGLLPPIADWLDWWADRNDCTNMQQKFTNDTKVQHLSWTCDGVDGLMQHYKVEGLGHAWADTEPNFSQLSVPQPPTVIRASEIVMEFFDSI